MSTKTLVKTTFDLGNAIRPTFTGGDVALDSSGQVLASCLHEDVILTDLRTGVELCRIEGDGEAITALSVSPDSSCLVVCSRSFSMRIFSLSPKNSTVDSLTAELRRTVKPHDSPVITLSIDQTSSLVATGGADGLVKVWDLRAGFATHTLKGHSGIISALRFFEITSSSSHNDPHLGRNRKGRGGQHRDAKPHEADDLATDRTKEFRLASGAEDGKIRIWDLRKRTCISVLDSHVSVVRGLDYSPEENVLVSGSRDKTLTIWDAASWEIKKVLPILERIECCGFVKGGQILFTGGENGKLRLWEATGQEVSHEQTVGSENDAITAILSYPLLPFLMTVHADQSLLLHSLRPLEDRVRGTAIPPLPVIRRISGTHDDIIDLAYVSPALDHLALATNSENLRIISIKPAANTSATSTLEWAGGNYFGADAGLLKGHDDIIICIDVDCSGEWIATGAKDNTARLWHVDASRSSFVCYAVFTGHTESLGAVALARSDTKTHTADVPHSTKVRTTPPTFLITGSQDRTIKRWEVARPVSSTLEPRKPPRTLYTRRAHEKDINALDTNYDSTLFASASQDRTVKIWSIEEGEVQGILRGHRRGVWSVRFAPKDTPGFGGGDSGASSRGLILTGSGDKTVKIWSLADYSCLRTFEGHTNSVLKVLWLPACPPSPAPQVASSGSDGLVKVWNASSSELACTLDNHTDRVWALATASSQSSSTPSQDKPLQSRTLISAGADSTISFWTDSTSHTTLESQRNAASLVEADQRLANLTRAGSYRDALILALTLSHRAPARLLSLLTSVTSTNPPEQGSICGILAVDAVLADLSHGQLWRLLLRLRDWNTNARTAPVAQKVLAVLLRSYPPEVWAKLGKRRRRDVEDENDEDEGGKRIGSKAQAAPGVNDVLDGIRAYTERHYRRIEELVQDSYLVEYTLGEMEGLGLGEEDQDMVDAVGEERPWAILGVNGTNGEDVAMA